MAKIKHYTVEDAMNYVGKYINFKVGLKACIEKFNEIIEHGEGYYDHCDPCGFCFIKDNIMDKMIEKNIDIKSVIDNVPEYYICGGLGICLRANVCATKSPKQILRIYKTKKFQKAIDECNKIVKEALKCQK